MPSRGARHRLVGWRDVSGGVREVRLALDGTVLEGALAMPRGALGLVLFAHGSGSSRLSPRNRQVAAALEARGIGTLLFDLLTADEGADRANVFDIALLASRLAAAARWASGQPEVRDLPLGYFGASTGGAAALVAAADGPVRVAAIVSRGGRPDLAGNALERVRTPTLLIVGGDDEAVLDLHRRVLPRLGAWARLEVIPGATHLFEEAGALDEVARLAADWFAAHFAARRTA